MALTEQHLRSATEVLAAAATLREAAQLWHVRHPEVRTVLVDAMDMRDETPALHAGGRTAWLAATNGHCWHVTQSPEDASALILAQD